MRRSSAGQSRPAAAIPFLRFQPAALHTQTQTERTASRPRALYLSHVRRTAFAPFGFLSRIQSRAISEELRKSSSSTTTLLSTFLEAPMRPTLQRCFLAATAAVAAIGYTVPAVAQAAPNAPVTYNTQCGIADQSLDTQGRRVIVTQCGGDLPGVLTLVLSNSADGSLSGEWALNVSYTAPLHPDAQPDPNSPDPDEAQGEQLIQKGTLSGTIAGGSATVANGQVTALTSLQLGITGGSIQFAGLTKGSGAVNATHVDDRIASTAYLTLTF